MQFTAVAITIQLINLALLALIPTVIGIYVYRDAKQRNMHAALWALVAVFTPIFIGLIIYLLSRANYSNLKCPNCTSSISEQYTVCPRCGTRLKATCPSCGFCVEEDWIVCPNCTVALPTQQPGNYIPPVQKKDTAINKVLLLAILIPVLLVMVSLLGMASFRSLSVTRATNDMRDSFPKASDMDDFKNNQEVQAWIKTCEMDTLNMHAFYEYLDLQDRLVCYYLVYWPLMYNDYSVLYNGTIQVHFTKTDGADLDSNQLLYVPVYDPVHEVELEIFVNGERVDCLVTNRD